MIFLSQIRNSSFVLIGIFYLSLISSVQASSKELTEAGFKQYVVKLKEEAVIKGYETALIDSAFAKVKFHQRAVKADRSQPENVETLDT